MPVGDSAPPSRRVTAKPAMWATGQRRKLVRKSVMPRSQTTPDLPGANDDCSDPVNGGCDTMSDRPTSHTACKGQNGFSTPVPSMPILTADPPTPSSDTKKKRSVFSRRGKASHQPPRLLPTTPVPMGIQKHSPKAAKLLGLVPADNDDDEEDANSDTEVVISEAHDDDHDSDQVFGPECHMAEDYEREEEDLYSSQSTTEVRRLQMSFSRSMLNLKPTDSMKQSSYKDSNGDMDNAPTIAEAASKRSKNPLKAFNWLDLAPSFRVRTRITDQDEVEETAPKSKREPTKANISYPTAAIGFAPMGSMYAYSAAEEPAPKISTWRKGRKMKKKLPKPLQMMTPITEASRSDSTDLDENRPRSAPQDCLEHEVRQVYSRGSLNRSFTEPGFARHNLTLDEQPSDEEIEIVNEAKQIADSPTQIEALQSSASHHENIREVTTKSPLQKMELKLLDIGVAKMTQKANDMARGVVRHEVQRLRAQHENRKLELEEMYLERLSPGIPEPTVSLESSLIEEEVIDVYMDEKVDDDSDVQDDDIGSGLDTDDEPFICEPECAIFARVIAKPRLVKMMRVRPDHIYVDSPRGRDDFRVESFKENMGPLMVRLE